MKKSIIMTQNISTQTEKQMRYPVKASAVIAMAIDHSLILYRRIFMYLLPFITISLLYNASMLLLVMRTFHSRVNNYAMFTIN